MRGAWLMVLSTLSLGLGVLFILFPNPLTRLNSVLNQTLAILDQHLMRYRYLIGALLLVVSYLFFNLVVQLNDAPG